MTKKLDIIVDAIEKKKGKDILVLDFKGSSSVCDYAIICTGSSNRNIRAIADSVEEDLKLNDLEKYGIEGYDEAKWILVDCGDVLVNVFDEETRANYKLEVLWNSTVEL